MDNSSDSSGKYLSIAYQMSIFFILFGDILSFYVNSNINEILILFSISSIILILISLKKFDGFKYCEIIVIILLLFMRFSESYLLNNITVILKKKSLNENQHSIISLYDHFLSIIAGILSIYFINYFFKCS